MDERRKLLGQHIKKTRRAAPYRYRSQKAFAEAIDKHETSVAYAETGHERVGDAVYEAIEAGLDFPAGSIAAYLAGHTDELPRSEAKQAPAPGVPHEWSAESRARILAMSVEDIIEMGRQLRVTSGDRPAILWLSEATRIKAEAEAIPAGKDAT